jgi:cyanophycinase
MKANKFLYASFIFLLCCFAANAQTKPTSPKGKLFIIGGGDRPPSLMKSLLNAAALEQNDYAVVLPMSSEEPDTSYYYFREDWLPVSDRPLANFNFTAQKVNDKNWLDSLKHAKLIFITGGDQERFMKVVLNTPVYDAIHAAYQNGATIAGTSAGAAVMSQRMITGKEFTDTVYRATFRKLQDSNIEIKTGLGLLTNAVIDQHFIVRSRYNRLLSALALYPSLACIGIDEETAIIVQGNKVKVTGGSQVIVMRNPTQLKITANKLVKFNDIQFSIYTDGDEFLIGSDK